MVVKEDVPRVREMSDRHGFDGLLDSFSGDLKSESFGFNRSIGRLSSSGDYVCFLTPLPRIRIETRFACEDCGGTGDCLEPYSVLEDKCRRCWGTGRKHVNDWRGVFATTASLSLLFDLLELCDETTATEEQHVIVSMMADYGQHGSSLCGCFGASFSNYLHLDSTAANVTVPGAIEAMKRAYGFMYELGKYHRHDFRGDVHDGFLSLSCPGDACGIHHSDYWREPGGREFSCHNVDSPLQSLTLLAGISSLVGQFDAVLS